MASRFLRIPIHSTALVLSAALGLGGPCGASADQPAPASTNGGPGPTQEVAAGQAAYAQHCARCHGAQGRGDGLDAKRFYPRPRDLTLGVYKFRTTAGGTPPSDEDLFKTITVGLLGTNMPGWEQLDEATRWQLVHYLKSLAPVFEQTPPAPVQLTPDPGPSGADVAKGRGVYEQLGCAACHGSQGRANGTSAAGLVDDWGLPIRPANLTQGWSYRGGSDPRSILLRLLAGIDGAGMPSYAEAVSPEDAWHLAYYVASLQEPARWNLIAQATAVSGALPEQPDDPRWASVKAADVRLRNVVGPEGEWQHPPTVKSVSFRVVANDDALAMHLTWDDPTQDVEGTGDRLAVVFKTAGVSGDVVSLQAWPYQGAPPLDVCVWSAQGGPRPDDDEHRGGQTIEVVTADLERIIAPSDSQSPAVLSSAAHYADGRWQLVIQRPRQPGIPEGAWVMASGAFTPVAFMVWDGGNPQARAVSPWVDVVLPGAEAGSSHH